MDYRLWIIEGNRAERAAWLLFDEVICSPSLIRRRGSYQTQSETLLLRIVTKQGER